MVFIRYFLGFRESYNLSIATFDGMIMGIVVALALVVIVPGGSTLLNIRTNTSEVIKLKNSKKTDEELSDENLASKTLTFREIIDTIYGP